MSDASLKEIARVQAARFDRMQVKACLSLMQANEAQIIWLLNTNRVMEIDVEMELERRKELDQ